MSRRDEFLERLRATFRMEAEEHLAQLGAGLLAMEDAADAGPEVLEVVYRAAHSLKGAARAVGIGPVEELCQSLEGLLAVWKRGELAPTRAAYDLLHRCLDALQDLTAGGADGQEDRVAALARSLEDAAEGVEPEPPAAKPAAVLPAAPRPAPPPVATPARPEAPRPTPATPSRPEAPRPTPATPSRPETPAPTQHPEPASGAPPEDTRTPQETAPPPGPAPRPEPTPAPKSKPRPTPETRPEPASRPDPAAARKAADRTRTVKVMASRLDGLLLQIEGTVSAKLTAQKLHEDLHGVVAELERDAARDAALPPEEQAAAARALQRRLEELTREALVHSKSLGRMVDQLLDETKRLAMQPFSTLLDAFPRMLRDIARQEGKEVQLQIDGGEVEIDKRILDELRDPMTHLLRNSIDHGIEAPARRAELGKDPKGTIRVSVAQVDGGKVQVRIDDDGGGLDLDRIRRAAAGSAPPGSDRADSTDEAAARLIFESGVSSAPIVTDLSGRGLGLAIVREKVEGLGGTITVESARGRGTTFRILLPLTMATFRGVLVQVDEHELIVPAGSVSRVLRVDHEGVKAVEGRETLLLDGRVVPLVRLEEVLELPRRNLPGVRQRFAQVLVLTAGGRDVGFAVDRVVREQEVLVKGLGSQLRRVRNVAAATVLGSGRVVPILSVPDLVKSAERITSSAGPQAQAKGTTARSVLVAEDSITSRMLLKNILESAGYRVKTAVDGAEALAALRTEPFDLLVSDVEMPRMNGFELTEQVRKDPRLQALPVILVTALASREHRERGIDAGANAYILKSSFDQNNLLETVARFL